MCASLHLVDHSATDGQYTDPVCISGYGSYHLNRPSVETSLLGSLGAQVQSRTFSEMGYAD